MQKGTIKKILKEKGFGFIAGERGEIFFHRSAVEGIDFDDLEIGQSVEFQLGQGPKGPKAENVKVV